MRLLVDTVAFLFAAREPGRLSASAAAALASGGNDVYPSAVSVLEVAIKVGTRKLVLHQPLPEFIAEQTAQLGVIPLHVRSEHALGVAELPLLHRDPFDRLLIAQARAEGLTLVSSDPQVARYPVATLW